MTEVEKCAAAVKALASDWERQERCLRRSQVERLILRRRLSLDIAVSVFGELKKLGIRLDESRGGEIGDDADANRGQKVPFDDFVPGFFSEKLLSHREELELGRAIQLGLLAKTDLEEVPGNEDLLAFVRQGERARTLLVEANLRLVLSVACKIGGYGHPEIQDLVQAGAIGLLRAAELYDPDLCLKFSTYATHWIRQAISRNMDNFGRMIRLPIYQLVNLRQLHRTKRLLTLEIGRNPTASEIADALAWRAEKVAYLQTFAFVQNVSIDAPEGLDAVSFGDTLVTTIPNPEQECIQKEIDQLVHDLVRSLPPRQRLVLTRRFGLRDGHEETLQQIGDDLQVTRERIRQIEAKALMRIQLHARAKNLAPSL